MNEEKRKRTITIRFRVTQQEKELIEQKMSQFGTRNREAYLRKMAIDGYVINLDLPELKEITSLLRRSGSNINQIAKRVNQTERIYQRELDSILQQQEAIWNALHELLTRLSSIA